MISAQTSRLELIPPPGIIATTPPHEVKKDPWRSPQVVGVRQGLQGRLGTTPEPMRMSTGPTPASSHIPEEKHTPPTLPNTLLYEPDPNQFTFGTSPNVTHSSSGSAHSQIYPVTFQMQAFQPFYMGLPPQPIPIPNGDRPSAYASLAESPPMVLPMIQNGLLNAHSAPVTTIPAAAAAAAAVTLPVKNTYSSARSEPRLGRRTKVSRACDECRRKKTRCDMEAEHDICIPCSRAGTRCTFVRTQLRRGPSRRRQSSGASANASVSASVGANAVPLNIGSFPISTAPICGTRQRSRSDPVPRYVHDYPSLGLPALAEAACREPSHPPQKAQTPPSQFDKLLSGVSHSALMVYYTFVHPIFPLLPDLISDFNTMFEHGGSARENLAVALNTTTSYSSSGTVILVTSVNGVSMSLSSKIGEDSAGLECHLIALLLTYLHTLDATWIGAGVAAATALIDVSSRSGQQTTQIRARQLAAILVVLDRLHCAVNATQSLVPTSLVQTAGECSRMQHTLMAFISPELVDKAQFSTASQVALLELGKLSVDGNRARAQAVLAPFASQLQRTPLEPFVQRVLR